MNLSAPEQLRILLNGIVQVVPADDFRRAVDGAARGDRPPLRVKFGVDPTRPDLHLGHAVPLRKLRQFQDLGHTAVLVIGGFTAQVGDPSGRSGTAVRDERRRGQGRCEDLSRSGRASPAR